LSIRCGENLLVEEFAAGQQQQQVKKSWAKQQHSTAANSSHKSIEEDYLQLQRAYQSRTKFF
jgi:hypothetical protein